MRRLPGLIAVTVGDRVRFRSMDADEAWLRDRAAGVLGLYGKNDLPMYSERCPMPEEVESFLASGSSATVSEVQEGKPVAFKVEECPGWWFTSAWLEE